MEEQNEIIPPRHQTQVRSLDLLGSHHSTLRSIHFSSWNASFESADGGIQVEMTERSFNPIGGSPPFTTRAESG